MPHPIRRMGRLFKDGKKGTSTCYNLANKCNLFSCMKMLLRRCFRSGHLLSIAALSRFRISPMCSCVVKTKNIYWYNCKATFLWNFKLVSVCNNIYKRSTVLVVSDLLNMILKALVEPDTMCNLYKSYVMTICKWYVMIYIYLI